MVVTQPRTVHEDRGFVVKVLKEHPQLLGNLCVVRETYVCLYTPLEL